MKVPEEDLRIGMETYVTSTRPIKARIRQVLDDFLVEEIIKPDAIIKIHKRPHEEDKYVILKIIKRGEDTIKTVSKISSELGLKIGKIKFLGLKDSRSVSVQYLCISASDIDLKRLRKIQATFIGWINRLLTKEDLLGNKFLIRVVIDNRGYERVIIEALDQIEEKGVPNFYSYQRFGYPRGITHIIGRFIVKREFKKAVLAYLTMRSGFERKEIEEWRRELEGDFNFKRAYKTVPRGLIYEKMMLRALIRHNNYLKALRALPITLRKLFVNAYQSLLFNKSLSRRILRGNPITRPVTGDLCYDYRRKRITTQKYDSSFVVPALQVIGFGYKKLDGEQTEVDEEIMKEEEITPKMFYIKEMPEISCKGGIRRACLTFWDLSTEILRERKEILLSFKLSKGEYATTLLREIIKPRSPIKQGF